MCCFDTNLAGVPLGGFGSVLMVVITPWASTNGVKQLVLFICLSVALLRLSKSGSIPSLSYCCLYHFIYSIKYVTLRRSKAAYSLRPIFIPVRVRYGVPPEGIAWILRHLLYEVSRWVSC